MSKSFHSSSNAQPNAQQQTRALMANPAMSRRTFFAGAAATVGALVYQSMVCKGNLVIEAYADEAGNNSFVIMIISREEIGCAVYDVKNNNAGLTDAKLTVKSYFTQTEVSGTTSKSGFAIFNVRQVSEQKGENDAYEYSFWGKVTATKQGYRDFETGRMRIVAGAPANKRPNVQVYTQPDDGTPYLRLLTFDGFDVQYATSSVAPCKGNDADHTLQADIKTSSGTSVTARWIQGGEKRSETRAYANSFGIASFAFKDKWLTKLTPEKPSTLEFEVAGKCYTAEVKLVVLKPAMSIDECKQFDSQGLCIGGMLKPSGSDSGYGFNLLTIPRDFPVAGGASLDVDLPIFPLAFYFDPTGKVGVGVKMSQIAPYSTDSGTYDPKTWKALNKKTYTQANERMESNYSKACERYEASKMSRKDRELTGKSPKMSGADVKFNASVMATGEWDWTSNEWQAGAEAMASLLLMYSYQRQFMLGWVPVYLGFDIRFQGNAVAYIGMKMKSLDFSSITWANGGKRGSKSKTGFILSFLWEFGLSMGIGVKGIASFGVRGYAYLKFLMEFTKVAHDKGHFPHLLVAGGAGVEAIAQFLMFKIQKTIYNKEWPLLDNYKSNLDTYEDYEMEEADYRFPAGFEGYNLEVEDTLIPVTAQEMLYTIEFVCDLVNEQETAPLSEQLNLGQPADGQEEGAAKEAVANGSAKVSEEEPGQTVGAVEEDISTQELEAETPDAFTLYRKEKVVATYLKERTDPDGVNIGPSSTDAICSASGFIPSSTAGVDYHLGAVPAMEEKILKDTFSDPRTKIVDVGGTLCMFRIATVEMRKSPGHTVDENDNIIQTEDGDFEPSDVQWGTQTRSRLTLSTFDKTTGKWSYPDQLDLRWDNEDSKKYGSPYDYYAYDFDVISGYRKSDPAQSEDGAIMDDLSEFTSDGDAPEPDKTGEPFAIVLMTAGKRPKKDDPSFNEVFKDLVLLRCTYRPQVKDKDVNIWNVKADWSYYNSTHNGAPVGVGTPRLIALEHNWWGTVAGFAILVYGRHLTTFTMENCYQAGLIWPNLNSLISDREAGEWNTHIPQDLVLAPMYDFMYKLVFAVCRVKTFRTSTNDNQRTTCDTTLAIFQEKNGVNAVVAPNTYLDVDEFESASPSIVGWPSRGFFFPAPIDREKQGSEVVKISGAVLDVDRNRTIKPDLFELNSFDYSVSEDGKYLFSMDVKHGREPQMEIDGYTEEQLNAEDGPVLSGDPTGKDKQQYVIRAAKWYAGATKFSNFFPFAQTKNPVDHIISSKEEGSEVKFIYTSITNIKKSRADLYYTKVPFLKALQLDGAVCLDTCVGAGDSCNVGVKVYNSGNLGLSKFSISIYEDKEGKGTPVVTKVIDCSMANMCETPLDAYDFESECVREDGADKEGILLPGVSRSYSLQFTIPKGWHGEKELFVKLEGIEVATMENGYELYGEDLTGLSPLSEEYTTQGDEVDTASGETVYEDLDTELEPLSVSTLEDGYTVGFDGTENTYTVSTVGGGGGGEEPQKKGDASSTVKTGDEVNLILPAAVVAAGAGMMAYSKRRMDIEAEAAADEPTE